MANVPVIKRKALLEEFYSQNLSINRYSLKKKIKQTTFRDWLKKDKEEKQESGENMEMFDKVRKVNVPGTYNHLPLAEKIKVLRTHISEGIPMKKTGEIHGVSVSVISYWKAQWKTGKILIPGLAPKENIPQTQVITRHSALAKAKNSRPLAFDYEGQVEMTKLQAQIDYLKDLLEENGIEWAIDKTEGQARDKYVLAIIKANGIELGLQSEAA